MSIDRFALLGRVGGRFPANMDDLDAVTTCYHYLVATDHKKDKETGADALRAKWGKARLAVNVPEPDLDLWRLIKFPDTGLPILPRYSFVITLIFHLAQPYLSKDDDAFYIIDTPVRKDKVFKTPMVAPSSWKGSLRHALWQSGARHDGKEYFDKRVKHMFGETRDNETGQSGRLFFYPTFFDRMGLEIINPHDRERRVGKNPILFGCVPAGATGHFTLLYVPFDRIGQGEAGTRRQVAEDLTLLAQGLQDMFTTYGFGAKTSSGFGLAEESVFDGRVQTNTPDAVEATLPPQEPMKPDSLAAFLEDFPDEDFSLKPKEWRKQHQATNTQRKQYMEARKAYQQYRQAQEAYMAALAEWEAQVEEPVQNFIEAGFESFGALAEDVAKSLADKLTAGGDA